MSSNFSKPRGRKPNNLLCRYGWWYFKRKHLGRVICVSLATRDLTLAKAKRDMMLKKIINDELDQIKGPRKLMHATVGEVMGAYETKATTVNESLEPRTILGNLSAMRTFLAWAHGANGQKNESIKVESLPMTVFADEMLVNRFKQNYVATAGEDREAREARRRGAASILRQTKSIFSKQAMLLYRECNLPDLEPFRTAATMPAENRVHQPIPSSTLKEMWAAMAALRETQPQLWLVHQLQLFLGLRNDEICQARAEWFKRAPWGQVFFSVLRTPYFEPKRSQGHVPLTAEVAALLAPLVSGKQPQDFLIAAKHPTEREELVDKIHATWMRQFLPAGDFAKAGYELRRWAAQTMEARYGPDASKAFLRHTPQGVAERHYFEHWFPWRRLGSNVGVTIEEAMGGKLDTAPEVWQEGAAVFAPAPVPVSTTNVQS